MAVKQVNGKASWGKTYKGFSQALAEAGAILTQQGATMLTQTCEEWLDEVDSQWPRGARAQDQMNLNTGRTQRAYGTYKSGYRGGDHYFPWYTGNLHDSFVTRIAIGNRTVSIRQMKQGATVAQFDKKYGAIDGSEWGLIAASRGSHVFLPGLQAQLYIGGPYAEQVNEMREHEGYLRQMERDFASTIRNRMEYEFGHTRNLIIR